MVGSDEARSSPFAVTAAANSVRLDDKQSAVTTFTVSNASGRTLTGRAQLRTDQPAALPWLSVVGEPERVFPPNEAVQYSVNIAVPPGSPAGAYSFSLDMIGVENPDEMFSMGPPVSIEVKQVEVVKKELPSWWWMPVAAGVVLLIGGVLAFVVLRGDDAPREPVSGTITLATSSVVDLDSNSALGDPSDSDDLQYLEAGTTHVVVGINRARIAASGAGITPEQCLEAASNQDLDIGFVRIQGTTTICVATGESGASVVQAALVNQGGGGGRPATFTRSANEGVRALIAELGLDPRVTTPLPTTTDVRVAYNTQPR
ncbi:MAG: hypothetical protein GEU75_02300 [Dehalococcoidia bacterium]|nr:hypothetical protein [Dehalococcoidia bacterium]